MHLPRTFGESRNCFVWPTNGEIHSVFEMTLQPCHLSQSCKHTEPYKPSASVNINTSRPKKPNTAEMSSATTDVTGSSMWRNGLCIISLLCMLVATKDRPGLVNGCTNDSLGRFWVDEVEGLAINGCLTSAMQDPACEFSRRLLLRLSERWAEGFTTVVLDSQCVKRERFLAAY